MSKIETKDRLRKEQDILDRLENVRRLLEMETTLMTVKGAGIWCGFKFAARDNKAFGDNLLQCVRNETQMQLLSITALCYGDNPDIGEASPMLEWNMQYEGDEHPADAFRDMWEQCLRWDA